MTIKLVLYKNHNLLDLSHLNLVKVFEKAVWLNQKALPINNMQIDVVIKEGRNIIPELGISGYSPNQSEVNIWLQPTHPYLIEHFDVIFTAILSHELHHCCRYSTVGYGTTLIEALVSEGLACCYEEEIVNSPPLYVNHLYETTRNRLLKRAKPEWWSDSYNHTDWFFGNLNIGLPKWSGYDLGYQIVKDYLLLTKQTAAACVATEARLFCQAI